jgi:alpha-glucosidase (family GH31 glycosyl hydrolase)
MRPLLLEFPNDPECLDIGDQFTLGPDILVSPVLSANTASRNLYLPEGADWIDVRSGKRLEGGRWISADAPIDAIPVHVRAGSDNEAALSRIFRRR